MVWSEQVQQLSIKLNARNWKWQFVTAIEVLRDNVAKHSSRQNQRLSFGGRNIGLDGLNALYIWNGWVVVMFHRRLDIGNVRIFVRLDADCLCLTRRCSEPLAFPERCWTRGAVLDVEMILIVTKIGSTSWFLDKGGTGVWFYCHRHWEN